MSLFLLIALLFFHKLKTVKLRKIQYGDFTFELSSAQTTRSTVSDINLSNDDISNSNPVMTSTIVEMDPELDMLSHNDTPMLHENGTG